jgi:signal transduction histidine kinase
MPLRRLRAGTLGTRIGAATSAAILGVSLVFFAYRYVSETEALTDQLHAHMGQNISALTAGLRRVQGQSVLQAALEDFIRAVRHHLHEFGHAHEVEHLILVTDEHGMTVASTDRGRVGRSIAPELHALSRRQERSSADRFRVVELDGERYLFLSEPLGSAGQSILYLEPFERVVELARGSLLRNLGFSLLLATMLVFAVNVLVRRLITRRLALLAQAMQRVEREGLDVPIPDLGRDELGEVRNVYAATIAELRRSRQQIEEHARTLESQVSERTAQLVRAHRLAAVGELAAGVAHGLNNPLASIAASAEKLLDLQERDPARLEARLPEHLRRIVRNTDRCKHITQSLLSFGRESRFSPRPLLAAAVLHEAKSVVEAAAEARGVAVHIQAPGPLPPVTADAEALTQVLVNLASNALDASPPGSRVELSAARDADELVLAVTDRGSGIAPQDLERIFRPFYTTKPVGQGTGLGLSICQGIVEQLGGRLGVQSRPGEGSRFEVRLPLTVPDAKEPPR